MSIYLILINYCSNSISCFRLHFHPHLFYILFDYFWSTKIQFDFGLISVRLANSRHDLNERGTFFFSKFCSLLIRSSGISNNIRDQIRLQFYHPLLYFYWFRFSIFYSNHHGSEDPIYVMQFAMNFSFFQWLRYF